MDEVDPERVREPTMPPIVIVETDASHTNYDRQLVALLNQAEQERRSSEKMPFPRTDKIPAAVLDCDYHRVTVAAHADPAWHVQLTLRKAAQIVPERSARELSQRPMHLVTVHLPEPETSLEIIGMTVVAHADPADWLEAWLEQLGTAAVSSRPRRTPDGVMGDILATDRTPAGTRALRYATQRFGSRMFVLVLRTPVASYRQVARDFALALSSLTPLQGY